VRRSLFADGRIARTPFGIRAKRLTPARKNGQSLKISTRSSVVWIRIRILPSISPAKRKSQAARNGAGSQPTCATLAGQQENGWTCAVERKAWLRTHF